MNKSLTTAVLILLCAATAMARPGEFSDSLPHYGVGHKSSEIFRRFYHGNDFTYYLDNLDDQVTYQTETTGNYNMPDALMFSVAGNPYRWNRYYVDGFRADSRFFVGSTQFRPDMYTNSVDIDYMNSGVLFTSDAAIDNSVSFTYNVGGVGGVPGAFERFMQHLHETAMQRAYKPIKYRDRMQGAAQLSLNYGIRSGGKTYMQQFYADYGRRRHVTFDEGGIDGYYPEDFFRVNLRGQLPVEGGRLFDSWHYLFDVARRDNLYSELYYGADETARSTSASLSVYGTKRKDAAVYTSGVTLATHRIKHNSPGFMRNLIDQDGEGLEPWYAAGFMTELSYALNWERVLNSWLKVRFDGYNSLLNFAATGDDISNPVYMQHTKQAFCPLYVYDWHSESFWSGLLENTAGVSVERRLSRSVVLRADADMTLDGMVLSGGKSMVRPNWQVRAGLDIRPCKWFAMELNVGRYRVNYTWDDIRFFSDKYLNGDIYYWKDLNGDHRYQPDEKGAYFMSTGGRYHRRAGNLRQPSYIVLEIPVYFRFGRHKISFLNNFKKYMDTWYTQFDGTPEQYGYYDHADGTDVFFFKGGRTVNYEVGHYPKGLMEKDTWTNFVSNTPYYFSSVIKYEYTAPRFMFSLSWQSFLMAGVTAMGNGPVHNNLGTLSESTANPNNLYKAVGRIDQDRAYVARLLVSYNVTDHFSVSLTGKFKDGQPFSFYDTRTATDASGNTQMAMWRRTTKGINPLTGEFGTREGAFYNFDLKASYRGVISGKYPFEVQAYCYNMLDVGTELHEYVFTPYDYEALGLNDRLAMSLNIPRGLMFTFRMGL